MTIRHMYVAPREEGDSSLCKEATASSTLTDENLPVCAKCFNIHYEYAMEQQEVLNFMFDTLNAVEDLLGSRHTEFVNTFHHDKEDKEG